MHPGLPAFPALGAGDRHVPFRPRAATADEVYGIAADTLLARTTDPEIAAAGQDGGLVSALLIWALEHDIIDAALVSTSRVTAAPGRRCRRSRATAPTCCGRPAPATPTRRTRSPMRRPIAGGAERIALVGMGCQASAPAADAARRRAGKVARRFALTVGLLCSKTFDDAIFAELFEARYGFARATS